jgi:phage terminase Nu1 subunit (DNA packaging protein)
MPKLSQQEIGDHLGMSRQAAAEWLRTLGLSTDDGIDRIRLRYIEELRRQLALNGASTTERSRWIGLRADREALRLGRERGILVPLEEARRGIVVAVTRARGMLLGVPKQVQAQFPETAREVADLMGRLIEEVLTDLSKTRWPEETEGNDDERTPT